MLIVKIELIFIAYGMLLLPLRQPLHRVLRKVAKWRDCFWRGVLQECRMKEADIGFSKAGRLKHFDIYKICSYDSKPAVRIREQVRLWNYWINSTARQEKSERFGHPNKSNQTKKNKAVLSNGYLKWIDQSRISWIWNVHVFIVCARNINETFSLHSNNYYNSSLQPRGT